MLNIQGNIVGGLKKSIGQYRQDVDDSVTYTSHIRGGRVPKAGTYALSTLFGWVPYCP